MRFLRYVSGLTLLVLVVAACSVNVPPQEVSLFSNRSVEMTASAGGSGLDALQGVTSFEGVATATAGKLDERLTVSSFSLSLDFDSDFEVLSPEGGLTQDTVTFSSFAVSFTVSDGSQTLQVPLVPVFAGPVTVDITAPAVIEFDWDAVDPFVYAIAQNLINQVNDIIVGPSSQQFTVSLTVHFDADLPADTVIEITIANGTATVAGRGSL